MRTTEVSWEERWPPWRPSAKTFCVLDAARDPRIFRAVDATLLPKACLYAGPLDPEVELVAPYLVNFESEGELAEGFARRGWGQAWGVLLECSEPLAAVRRHLRGLLTVRDERGRKLLFRFYDPRVLRIFLPTCGREQLREIFGPIERYVVEGDAPDEAFEFRLSETGELTRTRWTRREET